MTDEGERTSETKPDYFPGEHGRTVPRSAWWILAGALALLLVFVFLRPSWFTRDVDDKSLDVSTDRHYTKSLAGAGYADGVWLTDDSPSASFSVTFPADSARTQTRLRLTGTTQVAQDSVVFLTTRMDGQQVFKGELPRGNNELDVIVDVPEQLAADGHIRVQVQVQGTLDNRTCTPDHSAGMQVHLDPDSVVEAALDEPVHTIRDAVVTWDRDVEVILTDQASEWRTAAAQLGIALTRSGYEVTFSDRMPESGHESSILIGPSEKLNDLGWSAPEERTGPLILGSVESLPVLAVTEPNGNLISSFLTNQVAATADSDSNDPRALVTAPVAGNEVTLGAYGADTSIVQIADSHRWRVDYSLADLPGGRLPQSVRVAFDLPASPDDLTWILDVQLNDQLVESRRLDNSTFVQADIILPAASQKLENTLTLTVQRDRDLGGCDVRVTTYPIQLDASSALVLGDDPGAGFTALPRALSPGFAVYWPDTGDAPAADQLNATIPVLTEFVPSQYEPTFEWGTGPVAGRPFVLIGRSPDVAASVRIDDGRLVAGPGAAPSLDLSSFGDGMIVQTATSASGFGGLVIDYTGNPGAIALPDFGTEPAQVITAQGSFAVSDEGTISSSAPPRANAPR